MPFVPATVTRRGFLAIVAGFSWFAGGVQGATPAEGVAYFEEHVRPLLEDRCYDCHSTEAGKAKGGLKLDTREGWMKGGESGPAIVPGKPEESLLIRGVRYWDQDFQMPPKHALDPEQVNELIEWVKLGAPDPREGEAAAAKGAAGAGAAGAPASKIDWEKGRRHWAFQPVQAQALPAVKDAAWTRNEVDFFTLARMEQAGVAPGPDVDAPTLIRRATYDLTGLPPTPQEVEAFAADTAPGAFARLVDRLLATPQYGERWGRHWLDVTRYADTSGNASDYPVPQAYKYRDYVIAAFNADMPYDRFVREQVAGDLLPAASEEERERQIVATGYLASARRFAGGKGEPHLTIEDTIDNLGHAFLGLSLNCARCHDHKFDPVSSADYYALYGVFSSTEFPHPGSEGKNRPENLTPLMAPTELETAKKTWQEQLTMLETAAKECDEAKAVVEKEPDTPERKETIEQLKKDGAGLREQRRVLMDMPPWEQAYAVKEGTPADARLQVRGDPQRLGETVPRHFPTILGGQLLATEGKASGRRELAEAIVSPENPLTARVLVNRLWQHHFGRGLVATPNDFGVRGQAPTHPELLDFLAKRFVEGGWSMKAIHRLILNSHTWQLASEGPRPEADHDNALWSRADRRRLDAECVRDALLAVSGELDLTPGGPHPFPAVPTWNFTQHQPFFTNYETPKRTVYQMQQRLRRHPFLGLFDGPDPNGSTAVRQISTTPLQALFVMNDPFVHDCAAKFTARVMRESSDDDWARIELAFQILYGRKPQAEERQMAADYLAQLGARQLPADQAWQSLSRALLAANEFIYLD